MLRRIVFGLSVLVVFSACKEDTQKAAPAPATSSADQITINGLNTQISTLGSQYNTCVAERDACRVSLNQLTGTNPMPGGTGVVAGSNSLVTMAIQLAMSLLSKNNGSCAAGVFQQCVAGTTTALYCNDQGNGFVSKVVPGNCGAP